MCVCARTSRCGVCTSSHLLRHTCEFLYISQLLLQLFLSLIQLLLVVNLFVHPPPSFLLLRTHKRFPSLFLEPLDSFIQPNTNEDLVHMFGSTAAWPPVHPHPDSRYFGRQGQNALLAWSTTCTAVKQRRRATHIEFMRMELDTTGPAARGEGTRESVSSAPPVTQFFDTDRPPLCRQFPLARSLSWSG